MKIKLLTILASMLVMASFDADAQRHNMRPSRPHADHSGEFFKGIGLTFGYVNSNYRTVDLATDEPTTTALLHGFTAGVTKDFTLLRHALYFQTGLNYIYQDDSRNETIKMPGTDLALRLVGDREEHHLAIPLRLKYDVHLVDNVGLPLTPVRPFLWVFHPNMSTGPDSRRILRLLSSITFIMPR